MTESFETISRDGITTYRVNDGWVVAQDGFGWLPGSFDSDHTARLAATLDYATMQRLQDAANERAVRVVTSADVRARLDPLPQPDSCHPEYQAHRARLQGWLNDDSMRDVAVVLIPLRLQDWLKDDDASSPDRPLPRRTLTRRRYAGLAPYVGAPFVYQWNVATDEFGQAVAGSTRIVRIGSPC